MRKFLYLFLVSLISFICVSCDEGGMYESVPYEVNDVYFNIRKLADDETARNVYYSEAEFNKHFNIAVGTSADLEKVVDFSKNFVVTVTGASSKIRRTINVQDVLLKESTLFVRYTVQDHGEISFSTRPCMVASISRTYMDCDVAFQDVTGME